MQQYSKYGIVVLGERKRLFQLIQSLRKEVTAEPNVEPIITAPPKTVDRFDYNNSNKKTENNWLYEPESKNATFEEESDAYDTVDEEEEEYDDADLEIPAQLQQTLSILPRPHKERIRVVVRKRPLSTKEMNEGQKDIANMENEQTCAIYEPKVKVDLSKYIERHRFVFDEVFDENGDNQRIYESTARPLVANVFMGGRATCFAYGQTGAGKTYTMMGGGSSPGLYVLAARDIFQLISFPQYEHLAVNVSFFEIYGGKLYDLLNDRKKLTAREDAHSNVCIAGLKVHEVSNESELLNLIAYGNEVRSTGSTNVNADSSRSHAILQIQLIDTKQRSKRKRMYGKFSFIDLAGSERAADTANNDRKTRLEGAEINKSLLALKECIRALDRKAGHLPFRGSKLTMVLKDSFIGNARTVMVACISPNSESCENTLNTLRYANRVKELKSVGASGGTGREKVEKMSYGKMRRKIEEEEEEKQRTKQKEILEREKEQEKEKKLKEQQRKKQQLQQIHQMQREKERQSRQEKDEVSTQRPRENLNNQNDVEIMDADESKSHYWEDEYETDQLALTHKAIATEILDEQDNLIALHRQQVDIMMELMREEMILLNDVDRPGADVDNYVQNLNKILSQKAVVIRSLRDKVQSFQQRLTKEEELSRSFSSKRQQNK
eukprot:TRINITY_DN3159_c4_g1_i1.p1 TRINITY_DN3159_c4_g1~~TRINITY_DN3159_c4_g1_i1.p1  ORF type:complete len:710 (-),score=227.46 TRINITY_DN3159_c4_g1_i1:380-2374(-)